MSALTYYPATFVISRLGQLFFSLLLYTQGALSTQVCAGIHAQVGTPLCIYYPILILPGFISEVQPQTLNQGLGICYYLIDVLDSQSRGLPIGHVTLLANYWLHDLGKFLNLSMLQFFHHKMGIIITLLV